MQPGDTQADEQREEVQAQIDELLKSIEQRRESALAAKVDIETRIIQDIRQYNGICDDGLPPTKERRSEPGDSPTSILPPRLNLTRSRTRTCIARLADMVFPDNENAWTVTPPADIDSIDPSLFVDEHGQEIPRELWPEVAEQRTSALAEVVEDQLKAMRFNSKGRQFCEHCCITGTGVMFGPEMRREVKKRWTMVAAGVDESGKPQFTMISVSETTEKPDCEVVHPLHFFPEMARNMEECSGVHRVVMMTADQLKAAKVNGFNEETISYLTSEKPITTGTIYARMNSMDKQLGQKDCYDQSYAVWRFDGSLDLKQAQLLGLVPDDYKGDCERFLAEVHYCQGRVLKAKIGLIEGDLRLPYYVLAYEPVDDTMFGVGVPFMYRDTQRAINGQWAAANHNTAVSAGFQVIRRAGMMQSEDGSNEIRGPKSWVTTASALGELDNLIRFEVIPNNSAETISLMDRGIALGDECISLPMMASDEGKPDAAVATSSGFAMWSNAKNITQKNLAARADDALEQPFVDRLCAYNLQFTKRHDIRMAYVVTTHVEANAVKDVQAQHLVMAKQMVDADPELKIRLKPDVWLRELNRRIGLGVADMWRTDEEVAQIQEQMANQPGDPMVALKQAELELKKVEGERNAAQAAEDRKLDHVEKMRELDIREKEAESREYVADKQLQGDMIRADREIAVKESDASTKRMKAAGDLRINAEKVARDRLEAQVVTGAVDKKQEGF